MTGLKWLRGCSGQTTFFVTQALLAHQHRNGYGGREWGARRQSGSMRWTLFRAAEDIAGQLWAFVL